MPHFERDGTSLYYEDHGTGPAVLLSHGYTSTTRMWEGQVKALRDRYRVITWDMRGHGRSDYPSDPSAYSEAHTVADMAALLDEYGDTRAESINHPEYGQFLKLRSALYDFGPAVAFRFKQFSALFGMRLRRPGPCPLCRIDQDAGGRRLHFDLHPSQGHFHRV